MSRCPKDEEVCTMKKYYVYNYILWKEINSNEYNDTKEKL